MFRVFALTAAILAATVSSVSFAASPSLVIGPTPASAPAGRYVLDKPRGSIVASINHLGLSNYWFRFRTFDASFNYDPARPEASDLKVSIDVKSIDIGVDQRFNEELAGNDYLQAAKFPTITFESRKIVRTGKETADITGDLTMHGVTRPVTLKTRFNGAQKGIEGQVYMGFSATAALKRSEFGVMKYVGPVSDEIKIQIDAEFVRQN